MRNESRISAVLAEFASHNLVNDKGSLSVVLIMTRKARQLGLPMPTDAIATSRGGQVAGLGGAAVRKILADYGIKRLLASEGGRTSRGSLDIARKYVTLLNNLRDAGETIKQSDLENIERWWIDRVKDYFNRKGFDVELDSSNSTRAVVDAVLAQAQLRQKEMSGTKVVGVVLQHLVGAKLALMLGDDQVKHKPASESDEAGKTAGDFVIAETVIHVTSAPTPALIEKCAANIRKGLRPLIVCPRGLAGAALQLAESDQLGQRIEVFDVQQFISTNVIELSSFKSSGLKETTRAFIRKYNKIVSEVERDPSLTIDID